MGRKIFVLVNVAMLALAIGGAVLVGVLLAGLPEASTMQWARTPAGDRVLAAGQSRRIADGVRAMSDSVPAAILMGPAAAARLDDAARQPRAVRGAPKDPDRDAALALESAQTSATGSATLLFILLGVLGVSALLGFARLRVRGVTFLSSSLLALAAGGGFASLALLDASRVVLAVVTLLCTAALFGQIVTTNLLADSNHPYVVAAEQRLRAWPPEGRRRHLATRFIAGLGLSAVAVLGAAASLLLDSGPVVTFSTGAFATGLLIATLPIIAAARLAARPT